jgi:hypothetical protein
MPEKIFNSRFRSITHASEGGAAAAPAAPAATNPVTALMAGQVLRDGELILLLLRPSKWFILLTGLRFIAIVLLLMALVVIFEEKLHGRRQYLEAGLLLIVGRLTWGVLQWMGRLYILTDLRIIRLSGVFSVDVFDCPLRKVARTLLEISFQERLCRIGTIAIIPQDEELPIAHWQMIAHPRKVHEQIVATISKAKQGGTGA